ncbi:MAG: hypothetical protein SGPRY_007421 [Prymnesium sp.]
MPSALADNAGCRALACWLAKFLFDAFESCGSLVRTLAIRVFTRAYQKKGEAGVGERPPTLGPKLSELFFGQAGLLWPGAPPGEIRLLFLSFSFGC